MKICPSCAFENPDTYDQCLKCQTLLPLNNIQQQLNETEKRRFTNLQLPEEENAYINSWQTAMNQRFAWIHELGDKIVRFRFRLVLLLLILGSIITLTGITWILIKLSAL